MISEGRLEISSNAPLISNVTGAVTFSAEQATVETFTGEMGEGSFEVRGGASLQNLLNPYYELFLYGSRIQLTRAAGLKLTGEYGSLRFGRRFRWLDQGHRAFC